MRTRRSPRNQERLWKALSGPPVVPPLPFVEVRVFAWDTTLSEDRIFRGVYSTGIVWADRQREVDDDYARLAFLPYSTLVPTISPSCPAALRPAIEADIASMQARRGEDYPYSACGQTIRLGRDAVVTTGDGIGG